MPKLSDDFKNEVLSHAEELVRRYKEILKQIEQDRKKGRSIRPTDRQINKFWPLEIRKKQRLQARKYALR